MPDYELRNPQLDMMEACSKAIEEGGTLMAEGEPEPARHCLPIPIILSGKNDCLYGDNKPSGTACLKGPELSF